MCILLFVGSKATVLPIPDESLPDKSGPQAARPRDSRLLKDFSELPRVFRAVEFVVRSCCLLLFQVFGADLVWGSVAEA